MEDGGQVMTKAYKMIPCLFLYVNRRWTDLLLAYQSSYSKTCKRCTRKSYSNENVVYLQGLSWSYSSCIYNYLCNQYLSPLIFWVWIPLRRCNIMCLLRLQLRVGIPLMTRCTWYVQHYVINFVSNLSKL